MKNYLLCIFLAVFTISIYGQNHKNAADYRTDAINGNAIAQFYLGQSYFRGWGIKPDTIQAVYWWRKSAEQGNPAAQNNMGAAYSNGWGNLTQNKETAIYWYKKAAEKNGAFPQKNLGRIYWKIQCKLPPKTKRFCPLKTFNNAPLKSLDRWGYYYFM